MKHGDLVTYKGREIGRVKGESAGGTTWVVYRCAGDWGNFEIYTAESTPTANLGKGWTALKHTKWTRKKPYPGEGKIEVISEQDEGGTVKCVHYENTKYPDLNEGIEHVPVLNLIKYFYQL